MTRRSEIRQADANRIAKAAALAKVKAEIKLPSGATIVFSPADTTDKPPVAPIREIVL